MVYNNPIGQQFLNQFKGTVKPVQRNKFSKPPAYQKHVIIGQDDKLFSKVKVWCHGATLEFPETAIFFSMANGHGSAFCKIKLEDLEILSNMLTQATAELKTVIQNLDAEAQNVQKTLEFYQQIQSLADSQGQEEGQKGDND